MRNIKEALGAVLSSLSEENYQESLVRCRLWLELGRTYSGLTPSDLIFDAIWENKAACPSSVAHYPAAPLILRFVNEAESDPVLAPYSAGLRSRLCAMIMEEFIEDDLGLVYNGSCTTNNFYMDVNLIAHCVNHGYIEKAAIRNHILQPLISHPKFLGHHAFALRILFKIAGATFKAYADPSVVDRCFELLEDYCVHNQQARQWIQEVIVLREGGWKDLPPPPTFTTSKPKPIDTIQKDTCVTPIATSLGLPNTDPEPQAQQPPQPKSATTPDTETTPGSPTIQSPFSSVTTLSDFTIADPSDAEPPVDPNEPTAPVHHEIFYLEDGNVEALCGNTLFRVHTSVLSFHSPVLRQMLSRTNLETAESPGGFPRILSSDTAGDFTTLLKVIYLPGFPERNKVLDFETFSSLLQITEKYQIPVVRSQILEIVLSAYPETFKGLDPSKPLGESVFAGTTPHPNAVLNLFVQQRLTSALPLAYYMAARRGIDSLMNRNLPQGSVLSPEILQAAVKGLMTLREAERDGTYQLILSSKRSNQCSSMGCNSHKTGSSAQEAQQGVIDQIANPSRSGTKVLDVLSSGGIRRDEFCDSCVRGWETGHVELRKKAWDMLPTVFGLKN